MFSRQWVLTELLGQDAWLKLESVAVKIRLADLYQRVKFEAESES